jgi:predicted DNA-binding protein with PD1-like motif
MRCTEKKFGRCFDITLDYGEEINEALRDLARRENIENAVITSGLGGFDQFSLDYSGRAGQRWTNCVLQLASVQGMIVHGEPQVHAVVTLDGRDGITRVGRVGEGSRRLFYCEMMVQELLDGDCSHE